MATKKAQPKTQTTVLALDDEACNNEMVQRTLKPRDELRVLTATTGEQALRLMSMVPVDVLLIDYVMPEMNGVEFATRAKKIAPDSIMIMITAFPELREVARACGRGLFDHVLVKPWTPKELLDAVGRAVVAGRTKAKKTPRD